MSATGLVVRGLGKYYRDGDGVPRPVLGPIDLDIPPGEFVCVVGASGCGKTTFLRLVAGLARPDEGSIEVRGRPIDGPGPERGLVFQNDSLLPWRRALNNVAFGLEVRGVAREERLTRARAMLGLVGLSEAADLYPHELSGGMRQRVNLARALAIDPDILLMDEPFAALDAQTREIMQRELLAIWAQRRKTVLFITHQIDEAVYLADRVIVLGSRPGRVLADIAIDFSRPRDLRIKRSSAFLEHVDRIWGLVENEALSALNESA